MIRKYLDLVCKAERKLVRRVLLKTLTGQNILGTVADHKGTSVSRCICVNYMSWYLLSFHVTNVSVRIQKVQICPKCSTKLLILQVWQFGHIIDLYMWNPISGFNLSDLLLESLCDTLVCQ